MVCNQGLSAHQIRDRPFPLELPTSPPWDHPMKQEVRSATGGHGTGRSWSRRDFGPLAAGLQAPTLVVVR